MKKLLLSFLLVFTLILSIFSQENTLVFVHPTAYNLALFTNLINQKIVDIDNLKIIGVYHEKENYDYSKSESFILDNNYTNIELREIKESLSPDQLFQKNNCSSVYTDLFKESKGVFFFGGPDLPPAIYGEQMSLLTRMNDPYRHYFEASFFFHLLGGSQNENYIPLLEVNKDYTVYGICLGMQTMNIATGGTMTQDIPSEIYNLTYVEEVLASDNNNQHRNYNNNLVINSTLFSGNFHEIKINNPIPIIGDSKENLTPLVYSNHHQAIEKLGKGLSVLATSTDRKIIEAIAHKKYPNVLGIQFHPEGTYLHDFEIKYRKTPNDELNSGKQILIDHNSYQFHLDLWKVFSDKMNVY
ncbi:MAG: hypothetical protein GQ564_17005 [Bacteroidales bacterium]|nr:hypothetical protein [Bacteroidales bacterium]